MSTAEAIAGSTRRALVGVGCGELTVRGARRIPAEQVVLYAAGIAVVAAIYPAARRRWRLDRSSAGAPRRCRLRHRERGGGPTSTRPQATRLLAAVWASHALFDVAHGHDEGSRLPRWYPAWCAGYDLAVASHLARAA